LLARVQLSISKTTLAALPVRQLPATAPLTPLLNDLSQLADLFVLLLNDYHLITATPIREALTFLIVHLPPTVRLILITLCDGIDNSLLPSDYGSVTV